MLPPGIPAITALVVEINGREFHWRRKQFPYDKYQQNNIKSSVTWCKHCPLRPAISGSCLALVLVWFLFFFVGVMP